MTRVLTILCVLLLGTAPGAAAEDYGWTISRSSTDPHDATGPLPTGGKTRLYLWLDCTLNDGVNAMEAELAGSLAPFFSGYVPIHPSRNFGTGTTLRLGIGGCPHAGTLIGALEFFVLEQGDICLVASAANSLNVSVDCTPDVNRFPNAVSGYSGVGEPCRVGACADSLPCGTEETGEKPDR